MGYFSQAFDRKQLALCIFALGFGALTASAFNRLRSLPADQPGLMLPTGGVPTTLEDILDHPLSLEAAERLGGRTPGREKIKKKHHKVHEKVGEEEWEARVKPNFMREVAVRTINETGNPFPSAGDIADWIDTHPDEAEGLLDQSLERELD